MESNVSFEEIRDLFRQSQIEADRRKAEADKSAAESRAEFDRRLKELGRQIGGLGNRLGEFVEGVVRPGLVRLFREKGIEVHQTLRDLEAGRDGVSAQIDLLVVNADHAVVVEVKSKLETGDVDEHVERIGKFRFLFPQYRETRLLGAVAAMVVPGETARYAERRGMFVIGHAGDDAVFLNTPGFEPRAW
ncbi:MAG: CDK5RAP3 family protein [Proteobacteria bacterium]|jgi:hypothetical protein|nr:CDK5RAP3 family protein [Pseudomonadota bacterium]